MKYPTHRNFLGEWLTKNCLLGSGAEIGCADGCNAKRILEQWNGKKLYMVDPWASQSPCNYRERTNEDGEFFKWWNECVELAVRYPIVNLMRMLSVDAGPFIPDSSLDFCYIDAAHDAVNVINDIEVWYPKVKVGGLFGGHDFLNCKTNGWFCEVEDVVSEWSKKMNIPFHVTECTSWWMIKT